MTKPSGGYPDFQSSVSWKGTSLAASSTSYPVGNTDLATVNLTNYASLNLNMVAASGNSLVTLTWWLDSALTQRVDTQTFPLLSGDVATLIFPAIAPYVDVSIGVTGAVPQVLTWAATPTNTGADQVSYARPPVTAGEVGHTLTVSTNKTYGVNRIAPGQAYFFFNPYDATGKLQLDIQCLNENGTSALWLVKQPAPTVAVSGIITLPAMHVQATVTNNDGAASHSYDFTLVADGR